MDFGNAKTRVGEGFEGLIAVIKFEGEVTSIVVDADVFANRFLIIVLTFAPCEEAIEEGERFLGVFEMTERLGF